MGQVLYGSATTAHAVRCLGIEIEDVLEIANKSTSDQSDKIN